MRVFRSSSKTARRKRARKEMKNPMLAIRNRPHL